MDKLLLQIPEITGFETKYYLYDTEEIIPSKIFPPHLHDTVEIYLLIEGDASFMVENTVYALTPGDAVISKPNEMHNCVLNSNSKHKHACFWFDASSVFFVSALCRHDFGKNNIVSPSAKEKQEIFSIIKEMVKAHDNNKKMHEFSLVLRFLDIINSNVSESQTDTETVIPETLAEILSYVNENFAAIESVETLADKYFVSHSTLCRLFKEYLHTSPKMYLQTKKLGYSRILLKKGYSVYDACMESGFSDYSNYIRLFRSRFGVTPKKYGEN